MLMYNGGELNEPSDEIELVLERLPQISGDFCEAAFESHYTDTRRAADTLVESCSNDYEYARTVLSELVELLHRASETEDARKQFWTTAAKVCWYRFSS